MLKTSIRQIGLGSLAVLLFVGVPFGILNDFNLTEIVDALENITRLIATSTH